MVDLREYLQNGTWVSYKFHCHCIAYGKWQDDIIVNVTADFYLVYYHINSLCLVLEMILYGDSTAGAFVNVSWLRHSGGSWEHASRMEWTGPDFLDVH